MDTINRMYGFYPQSNFWAINEPDITNNFLDLPKVLSQIVYQKDVSFGQLMVTQDGLILCSFNIQLDAQDILKYLNSVLIILQSRASEHFFKPFIDPVELTLKDVIYHEYQGEQIAKFDIDSVEQLAQYQYLARFIGSYVNVNLNNLDTSKNSFWYKLIQHSVSSDKRITARSGRIIPKSVFDLVVQDLEIAGKDYMLVQLLAALNRSSQLYSLGDYDMSLIQSWFVIEAYLFKLLEKKTPGIDTAEMSSSEAIKQLKILKAIPYEVGNDLHSIRIARNKVVHSTFDSKADSSDAVIAIEAIKQFIQRDTGLTISINLPQQ